MVSSRAARHPARIRRLAQMPCGQLFFDRLLPVGQQVHCRVDLIVSGGAGDIEIGPEGDIGTGVPVSNADDPVATARTAAGRPLGLAGVDAGVVGAAKVVQICRPVPGFQERLRSQVAAVV